jgi:hypothetical protein
MISLCGQHDVNSGEQHAESDCEIPKAKCTAKAVQQDVMATTTTMTTTMNMVLDSTSQSRDRFVLVERKMSRIFNNKLLSNVS